MNRVSFYRLLYTTELQSALFAGFFCAICSLMVVIAAASASWPGLIGAVITMHWFAHLAGGDWHDMCRARAKLRSVIAEEAFK